MFFITPPPIVKGKSLKVMQCNIKPKAHKSRALPEIISGLGPNISGPRNSKVPFDFDNKSCLPRNTYDTPKSANLAILFSSIKMFKGLRSQCNTPYECM